MSLKNLSGKLYQKFMKMFQDNPVEVCRIFLSASDMKTRAVVKNASAVSPEDAWKIAFEELQKSLKSEKIDPKIFRVDWVITSEKITWENFLSLLDGTRRNYFRKGLAIDDDYKIALTEQEMNGNYMFYREGKDGSSNCVFRKDKFDAYCQKRFGCDFPTPESLQTVEIFETCGAFIQEGEEPKEITENNIHAGRRNVSPLDSEIFWSLAKNGANYLSKQVQKNGKFIYGYYAVYHKKSTIYNYLHHMMTIFSMLEVYGAYKKMPPMKLGKAIVNAIEYAVKNLIVYRNFEDGSKAAYVVEPSSKELKLGAAGLALLTLTKHAEIMRTKKYLPLMKDIAAGILSMQNPDGSFVHVLNSENFSVKDKFRVMSYDTEATFGLIRFYSLTKDEKILQAVELAFDRFVSANFWTNRDSWLAAAINELTIHKPEKKYFELGINNFLSFLPSIYRTDTPAPNLLGLLMSADSMIERMKNIPEMAELLAKINFDDFYSTVEERAKYFFDGYFWAELAMYFARPEELLGSFFNRNNAFSVRIEDMENYLWAAVDYRFYLERRKNQPAPVPSQNLLAEKNISETAKKFSIDNADEIDLEDFKKKFQAKNGQVFFMLHELKNTSAGLELSAFHRAKLFKKFLGLDVCFVTNEFQTDILKQRDNYGLDNDILNMYDFYQEIDRKNFELPEQNPPANPDKEIYRDVQDSLGFLSKREKIDEKTKKAIEIFYYRPDGTEALHEIYNVNKEKPSIKYAEIIGRDKKILRTFTSRKKLVSYWLSSIFNEKDKEYFLVGDKNFDYLQAYEDMRAAGVKNLHVFYHIHNRHLEMVQYEKNTPPAEKTLYGYLAEKNLQADEIILCTTRQRNDIARRYRLKNVVAIPHALKDFAPSNVEQDPFKIILVGRLHEQKRQDKAIEVFKIVSQAVPQAKLYFYGRGKLKSDLQKQVEEAGLKDKVLFEGFVSNIADAYSSAALSICTSDYEGFSMAIQESLQLGCPVVSFDCLYGPSDMVENDVNGFLVPLGDVEGMAQKIILILQNPDLLKKLSENAPKTMEKFSQTAVLKKWAALFLNFLPE